jgi:hypothetical protein
MLSDSPTTLTRSTVLSPEGATALLQTMPEALLMKLRRIYKLSLRPASPGFAYQHLEHIQALSASMLEALGEPVALSHEAIANLQDVVTKTVPKPYGQAHLDTTNARNGSSSVT